MSDPYVHIDTPPRTPSAASPDRAYRRRYHPANHPAVKRQIADALEAELPAYFVATEAEPEDRRCR